MVNVVGVKFKKAGKVYYFDPAGFDIALEDNVIVETARGMEFGTITMEPNRIKDSDIVQPLKKIVRKANEEDILKHEENVRKKEEALILCQEKVKKHNLDMKLIDVEYTFDNTKVIFYFTADGRVDFRELVKDLASVFKMRIELRQIGVRDEAKMKGGIGNCGKGLCCHTWLTEFHPVSIKMAKVQNLSLNPTKISGICGRLMCCLQYENDVYVEMKKGLPDVGERVKIPEGLAAVYSTNILEGTVTCRLVDRDNNLSAEVYTYKKEEIKRLDKRRKPRKEKETENIPEEIKDLLKD